MKKPFSIVFLGIAVAVMAHVSSTISWTTTSLDLGKVKANEVKELSFEFVNSGDTPVTILEAKGSCGCTVVDFSTNQIQPGSKATIRASFKSDKVGAFMKTVKVKTTASDEYVTLQFKGEVVI